MTYKLNLKMSNKSILFITGTRADFGKIKSLLSAVQDLQGFDLSIFVTGMHLDKDYGYTINEVLASGFRDEVYPFINFSRNKSMDLALSKTVAGLSDYIQGKNFDMIVVHGDRPEALAGAIVGSFNNILVAHIEGGEVSGTIDEMIRHSVSKLAHIHFVSNSNAKKRLVKMGEKPSSIAIIGSPDLDFIINNELPQLEKAKGHYDIDFEDFGIVLFHPVTTDENFSNNASIFINAIKKIKDNLIVIFPNNDLGSELIIKRYKDELFELPNVRAYPSLRFEYFLSLLKHSKYLLGNSSAGIHEAPYLKTPSINVGDRQNGRAFADSIISVPYEINTILSTIEEVKRMSFEFTNNFGDGNSSELFINELKREDLWAVAPQKYLYDY